jgi:hypothetical protein
MRILTALAAITLALVAPTAAKTPQPGPGRFVAVVDNPWFPLTPGTTLRYRGQKDGQPATDLFTVTCKRKTILGVRATVVHDRLFTDRDGLVEDTIDWYAQDRKGNVWYFGERTRELNHGKVIGRAGSWQAGVHGALAGIFMPGNPRPGDSHRQEYDKGHAEDHFKVTGVSGNRLTTTEWTPLEPGVRDRKVYQRGIGTVLEETVKGGSERFQLVSRR